MAPGSGDGYPSGPRGAYPTGDAWPTGFSGALSDPAAPGAHSSTGSGAAPFSSAFTLATGNGLVAVVENGIIVFVVNTAFKSLLQLALKASQFLVRTSSLDMANLCSSRDIVDRLIYYDTLFFYYM